MAGATPSTTLLAGLPEGWLTAFATALSPWGPSVAVLKDGDQRTAHGVRAIPVQRGWSDVTEALARDQTDHPPVTTAVIGALSSPTISSLTEALAALETAVTENDLGPQQLLATLIQSMLPRQSGRILLVTYDPRSMTRPQDAAIRGSARGIFTYLESLRPALQRRGISAGMLLISPMQRDNWDLSTSAEAIAAATAECLRKGTLQRVIKIR